MSDDTHEPIEPFELGQQQTGKSPKAAKYTPLFDQWWKAYPRKVAKFKAFQSWQNHVDEATTAKLVIADTEKRNRMQFWAADKSKIPMPTTFLNQRRWEDEWEDEVTTRGRETIASSPMPRMPEPKADEPMKSSWELMVNRLMRNYLMKAGGFTDSQLALFTRTKRDVMKQLMPVIDEEIELHERGSADRKAAKNEMAWLLASTLMNNLDINLGMNIGDRVIDMSKRPA